MRWLDVHIWNTTLDAGARERTWMKLFGDDIIHHACRHEVGMLRHVSKAWHSESDRARAFRRTVAKFSSQK